MTMSSDAKRGLSKTVRELREYLLDALHAAVETEYRFSIKRAQDADLDEARTARRRRFEGWIAEQLRAEAKAKKTGRTAEDFRRDAEKQAAYTLLNRLVFLRLLEAAELRSPHVVTGGWESRGYRDFRELAPALVQDDPTEGYGFLLRLVFEDLAHELPGLYGPAGVAELVPVGPAVLRRVVEALDQPALASCWDDDMTLGWVYQYWNDPEREALDAKLNSGGKVEPHEIASKTQMFTERYMVDWLLQNSLGPMWLAMCRKHGWTPACEAEGTLDALEARRVEWRAKRDAGEVELTELMPLHTDMERRWAYYVPQAIPDDAAEQAPATVRELKILDPAVGSGHFLVVAFDLLLALYREEASHHGEVGDDRWSDRAIVESILENNLHGIDLDPRAVQIAAAALWLKGKQACPEMQPREIHLVASNLRLGSLPDDDPALVELRRAVERDTGIPEPLTSTIVEVLRGADHLGSLLKIDDAIDKAIRAHREATAWSQMEIHLEEEERLETIVTGSGDTLVSSNGWTLVAQTRLLQPRAAVAQRLEAFLAKHTGSADLGLWLRGDQLAAGVRLIRILREDRYDLVVGNPPYQGTSKMADSKYVEQHYPLGRADLYAAFLLRGLELARPGGTSALLTMRNWMFIKQYAALREHLLDTFDLRALGDFDRGGFEDVPDEVVSVTVSVFRCEAHASRSTALCPTRRDDHSRDSERTQRKRAATLSHEGRHTFDPAALKVVPEWPLVYWWDDEFVRRYSSLPHVGTSGPIRYGLSTQNNLRWLRRCWEVGLSDVMLRSFSEAPGWDGSRWVPYVKGSAGMVWMDPVSDVLMWRLAGGELWAYPENRWGRGTDFYFCRGVAFVNIGATFSARTHRRQAIFGHVAGSVFGLPVPDALCLLNSRIARWVMESINPTIHFLTTDVERLPLFPIEGADAIFAQVEAAFTLHESHREPSVEFRRPGPSPWRHAQDWAQLAVDRPEGAPLPEYLEVLDPEPPTDHLAFGLGVALGRFGPAGGDREGILDPATADLSQALPHGILFLDTTLDDGDDRDGLGHPTAAPLHAAWAEHSPAIDTKRRSLREYLALDFFKDVHRQMYENRPIHWPLSSEKKTFVAWINIHRWDETTLRVLLAGPLHDAQVRLDGELTDLRAARDGRDEKAARKAEKRYEQVIKWREELRAFVEMVTLCAEKGPPPTDAKCPPRDVDARYVPDLDDGVMINSAALWPLLEPQWKDPKKWWKELASAKGKKDYDWSHLAMRYWPKRVDAKCKEDPSLGVAHGCFWRYHPERAWAWELRLQDEIGPDFRIEEVPYDPPGLPSGPTGDPGDAAHRARYLRDHTRDALAAVEKEANRRRGRGKDARALPEMRILEAGLWSFLPDECWALELRITEKQGAEFRLLAPDEAEARAAYEAAHPDQVAKRRAVLGGLAPSPGLFDDVERAVVGPPARRSLHELLPTLHREDLRVSYSASWDLHALAAVVRLAGGDVADGRAYRAIQVARNPLLVVPQLAQRDAAAARAVEVIAEGNSSDDDLDWGSTKASLESAGVIVRSKEGYRAGDGAYPVPESWMLRAELALAILDLLSAESLATVAALRPEASRESATGTRTG